MWTLSSHLQMWITQAGFFPDSGFLKTNSHLETYSSGISYNPHYHPNHLNTDFVSNNVNPYFPRNDMDRVVSPSELLTKRLQRLMAAMSHRKLNKVLPVTNQAEDTGYLLMFTGAKDNKG
ncbi:hypothetical protein Btru_009090 [Bulinus truncatus]|nr:hypothetical protein Btru_009090 [Bulinus truncatus]